MTKPKLNPKPRVPPPDPNRILWIYAEVAEKCGVSEMTIRREVDRGKLRCVRLGDGGRAPVRFQPLDVIEWIQGYIAAQTAKLTPEAQ